MPASTSEIHGEARGVASQAVENHSLIDTYISICIYIYYISDIYIYIYISDIYI